MKEFLGLSGNWKHGKTKDSIVTDITDGCDPDLLDYYGGAVVCESIPDEYTRSLIIAAPDLLKACMETLEFLNEMDNPRQESINAQIDTLQSAITKALTI